MLVRNCNYLTHLSLQKILKFYSLLEYSVHLFVSGNLVDQRKYIRRL